MDPTPVRKPLKIVMIGLKGLPVRADSGGIERHVEELGVRLAAMGHDVSAYVRPRFVDTKEASWRGIRLLRLPSIPTKSLDTLTHTLIASVAVLFRPADIVHYHGVGPATMAWIPKLFKPRSSIVITFHSIDRLHPKWGPVARAYLRFGEWCAVRFADATIAVSRTIQQYCRERFRAETVYIPNGSRFEDRPGSDQLKTWGLKPGGYILTVARLVRQKGIHHLIEAFSGLSTDKKLVIVGAPGFGGEYAEYIRNLSAGNSAIVFTGFQTGDALRQLFANAYLYVHPSEAEGLSVSILEAMSAGRCVLVSDIPENLEPIGDTGVTFVKADVADLREKLGSLFNHPEVVAERGARSREWASREYDWDRIAAATAALYARLRG